MGLDAFVVPGEASFDSQQRPRGYLGEQIAEAVELK